MRSLLLMTACTFFAAAGEPVLLLTAFEAREEGGPSTSWEALKDFQGKVFHGHRVETVKLRHDGPGSLDAPLKKAMQDFAPRAVLCFGDGTDKIQIEANAYNTYVDGALDDPNARRSEIVPAGWNQYPAKLPVRTLRNKLREEMEHVSVSGRMTTNTGNDLFYRVAALEPPPTVYGLIQLPRVGAPVPDHPRAWTLDDIKRAVSIAADMAAKHRLFRIQVVGDEYSGEELRPEERWPTQLVEKMRSGGTLSADPTAWLFRQFQAFDLSNLEPIAKDYDLFVLQYGMTDQFKGTHRGKFREATKRILQTAKRALDNDGSRIMVILIPNYTVSPWGKKNGYDSDTARRRLRDYNTVLSEEAERVGATVLDFGAVTTEAQDKEALFTPMGLYYSAKMHANWAENIFKVIQEKKITPRK